MRQTLLLADDSVTIQRVIELTFADEDIQVIAVGDGDRAIAALETERPDIVLADVEMPGRNGYEIAKHIRDTPDLAHIRVLLLTGASVPIDRNRAAAVADGVLAKPFEPQQVIAKVRELLAAPRKATVDFEAAGDVAQANPPRTAPTADQSASVDEYLMRLDEALSGRSEGQVAPARERSSRPNRQPSAPSPPPSGAPVGGLPSLDAAFAALLAAERTGSLPSPDALPAPPPPPESLVEEVTARVLNRLSAMEPALVRDVLTKVAERLIREEIERIKSTIDSTLSD